MLGWGRLFCLVLRTFISLVNSLQLRFLGLSFIFCRSLDLSIPLYELALQFVQQTNLTLPDGSQVVMPSVFRRPLTEEQHTWFWLVRIYGGSARVTEGPAHQVFPAPAPPQQFVQLDVERAGHTGRHSAVGL